MNASIDSTQLKVQSPAQPIAPSQPTRWKMALVLWMMVYPMITGLGFALEPLLKDRSPFVRNFVMTAIFVPVMVYGAVPVARKLVTKLDAK
jgi:antibiotic biosynthesis monooxygenase (ABM) superfamily enzyme